MPAFILILFFHATGGSGYETAAFSQQRYENKVACENAALAARMMNKDHIQTACVPNS